MPVDDALAAIDAIAAPAAWDPAADADRLLKLIPQVDGDHARRALTEALKHAAYRGSMEALERIEKLERRRRNRFVPFSVVKGGRHGA